MGTGKHDGRQNHRYVHSKFRHKTLTPRQLDAKTSQLMVLEMIPGSVFLKMKLCACNLLSNSEKPWNVECVQVCLDARGIRKDD